MSYFWVIVSRPEGSQAALSDPTAVKPTFIPDRDGTYVIALVVISGAKESLESLVTVKAATGNSAPVANAGPDQNVITGSLVTLDGGASSDADGDPLNFSWSFVSKPAGSTAALSEAAAAKPSFTADVDGAYVLRLVVNDSTLDSAAHTVTITASTSNAAPVANAGPDQNVATGSVVTLNGSGSADADGDLLAYSWAFTSRPAGSSATLSISTTVNPTFNTDRDGTYVLKLIVNDGLVDSQADSITITASTPRLELYRQSSSFVDPGYTLVSFPYNSSGVTNATVLGSSTYTLETYKLVAIGDSFTITNVAATDTTSKVMPFFQGLPNNIVVSDGSEIVFSLVSPLTSGNTAQLLYTFSVLETGQTFSSSITFRSN